MIGHDSLIEALKGLPPRQREVIVMRFFADLTIPEAAAAIGSSEGTVKSHASRALATLRELLIDDGRVMTEDELRCPVLTDEQFIEQLRSALRADRREPALDLLERIHADLAVDDPGSEAIRGCLGLVEPWRRPGHGWRSDSKADTDA